MTDKPRPVVSDRWQNRANDRVAVVTSVHVNAAGTWVEFRYEQRIPNARATRKLTEGLQRFWHKFSLYEAVTP